MITKEQRAEWLKLIGNGDSDLDSPTERRLASAVLALLAEVDRLTPRFEKDAGWVCLGGGVLMSGFRAARIIEAADNLCRTGDGLDALREAAYGTNWQENLRAAEQGQPG